MKRFVSINTDYLANFNDFKKPKKPKKLRKDKDWSLRRVLISLVFWLDVVFNNKKRLFSINTDYQMILNDFKSFWKAQKP